MPNRYTIEVFRDGQWTAVKSGLSATIAAFGAALAMLKGPGELCAPSIRTARFSTRKQRCPT